MSHKVVVALVLWAGMVACLPAAEGPSAGDYTPRPAGTVTFSKDIAKIVHHHCAPCHHEGQSAPFNLVTFADVSKRAKQILEVTESRAMPPWLAEHGFGNFANERRLTSQELGLIRQWVTEGAAEGDSGMTPAAPEWPDGWLEGKPDLVVTMAKPYQLGPEGPDVYRNFVIRVPSDRDRHVRAVEFSPGNRRIVHHAFIRLDEEGSLWRMEGKDGQPGFKDMIARAKMPGGQFLTWSPGGLPVVAPKGLAWRLPKNSDLVVQLHLHRTGKPETIQSSVGLYFTDEVPTNTCYTFKLTSFALNIPAGVTNEVVRDSFTLPVDLDLLAVFPHAHFLGKEMQGYATLPDGTRQWLLWIKQWDFRWQGDYRYTKPVHLPKGTTLNLQFSYDNSTNNTSNPNHPPKRVFYGEGSNDEMCELAFQVLTSRKEDLALLQDAVANHRRTLTADGFRQRVAFNPNDAEALTRLGMTLWGEKRSQEAWEYFERALKAQPDLAEAHYNKGVFLQFNDRVKEARPEFETAVRLDPNYAKAHQQLGFAFATLGQFADAERSLKKALELDPTDKITREGLEELRQRMRQNQPAK